MLNNSEPVLHTGIVRANKVRPHWLRESVRGEGTLAVHGMLGKYTVVKAFHMI